MRILTVAISLVLLLSVLSWKKVLIGGSLQNDSPIIENFKGKKFALITAAGDFPDRDARQLIDFFRNRDIQAVWIPMYFPCSRRIVNPELVKMVNDAEMIFFSGGFSEKLLFCLNGDSNNATSPNPFLDAIKRKQIAGSSAGAMTIPREAFFLTRSSEDSYQSIARGQVSGIVPKGLNMFSKGVIDPHMSERGRQGRLLVLTVQTKSQYGFGLDENTGFIEKENGDLEVTGAKGVVIYDKPSSLTDVTLHFLTTGDVLKDDGSIVFASWKQLCANLTEKPRETTTPFTHFREVSLQLARYHENLNWKGYSGRNPAVEVSLTKKDETKTVCGEREGNTHVSFSHMSASFSKQFNSKYFGDFEKFDFKYDD